MHSLDTCAGVQTKAEKMNISKYFSSDILCFPWKIGCLGTKIMGMYEYMKPGDIMFIFLVIHVVGSANTNKRRIKQLLHCYHAMTKFPCYPESSSPLRNKFAAYLVSCTGRLPEVG